MPELTKKRSTRMAGRPRPEALSRQASMKEKKNGATIVTGEMKMSLVSKVKRLSQEDLANFIEFVGELSDTKTSEN
jgi:hypothetical protein